MNKKHVQQKGAYFYFRRKLGGKDQYIRIPAPWEPEFDAVYERLCSESEPKSAPKPGSIAALVLAYRKSPDFLTEIGDNTRGNRVRYLDYLVEHYGDKTVSGLKTSHVYRIRDILSETPGTANATVSTLKILMDFAIRRDMRETNPAAGVKRLDLGEYEPWPADLLRVCMEQATPMTRLAIATGLCSGQRVSDCIRMQYGWINDGIMQLRNKKMKADVAIPMHSFWLDELARLPRRSVTLLYERTGAPFKTTGAIQSRLRALMKLPAVREIHADLVARELIEEDQRFSFHGLRKNACCYLLELGLSDTEVGSILGMSTEMVRHYGKRTRALMVARGAAERVTGGKIMPMPVGKPVRA
ncbi:tyrosine-type recombinase/integrase [Sphingomonas xinjiangensis]|uniref:Integrase n=1 Tax=Sphingomonas xinjiangensis TaxID=643568 RepID=A0A840YJW9_9SPHN|nr:integrase [Sphingomonas xinjiangensis]